MYLYEREQLRLSVPYLFDIFSIDRRIKEAYFKDGRIPVFTDGRYYGYAGEELLDMIYKFEHSHCCIIYAVHFQQHNDGKAYIFFVLPMEDDFLEGSIIRLDNHIYKVNALEYFDWLEREEVELSVFLYASASEFGRIG